MKEKILKILKEKYIIIYFLLVIIVFTFAIFISMNVSENAKIKKELYEYNQKNEKLKEKISSLNEQIQILGKNEKQIEIKQIIENLEKEQRDLEKQKEQLELEVKTLKGDVIKLRGEPKTYPAGHLTAGTDIPTGKYKIYGGSSNFVVYSSSGSLKVNIILGSNSLSVSEYIYTFSVGDKIQANSSFKLVSVE